MDSQLKRGLLEACVLSSLCRGDLWGYRIIKELANIIELSESTLYPVLRRLEAAGCVTSYQVPHSGRLRKFYSLTTLGRTRLGEFLAEWEQVLRVYQAVKEIYDEQK